MTRGRGIIGIFQQNWSFWHSLVVWRVRVLALIIPGTTLKTVGSLRGFYVVFHKSYDYWLPYICHILCYFFNGCRTNVSILYCTYTPFFYSCFLGCNLFVRLNFECECLHECARARWCCMWVGYVLANVHLFQAGCYCIYHLGLDYVYSSKRKLYEKSAIALTIVEFFALLLCMTEMN